MPAALGRVLVALVAAVALTACGTPGPAAPPAAAPPAAPPGSASAPPASSAAPGTGARFRPVGPVTAIGEPAALAVPAIDVDVDLMRLSLNPDRTMQVPPFGEAGWYTGAARPGAPGPAIIAAHVDTSAGPDVFYRLKELVAGDQVQVRASDGRDLRFVVERVERHPKGEFPTADVYGPTPQPTLRLVTCGGDFDRSAGSYKDNVIAFARLAPTG